MTTRTPLPAPPLHDAALWLIGAPAAALLAAYAWAKAPALSADAPDQIIAVILACALGALVASRHGATPDISLQEIESFMNPA